MQNGVHLTHEQKTALVYRAVFGERDPKTFKRRWGLQDKMSVQLYISGLLLLHAIGVPTEKLFGLLGAASKQGLLGLFALFAPR
jgi:hypothetical protein